MLYAVKLTPTIGSVTQYITSITYDAKGQRQTIVYGNGTTTAYTYDTNTFRVTRLFTSKAGSNYQDLNYWYDPVGNITKVKDTALRSLYFANAQILPKWSYYYDALYRLVSATGRELIGTATFGTKDNYNDSAWISPGYRPDDGAACQNYTENYNYDKVGNIMTLQHSGGASGSSYTRIYNYDSASNKLLSTTVGSTTYSNAYDHRGNIVQMPHLSSITFNAANEMSSCNLGGGGNVYYQYSGGQRGRKTVINGSLTTQRIYMSNHEIYRSYTGSTLNVERRTVHVADDTGRIAMYEYVSGGGDSYAPVLSRYIYSNHLSTATLELDNNASIISYEEYHPYGTTAFQEMNAAINATAKRYRYVGKERDDESGFYYMGARYYAPWLGRWCAVDLLQNKYAAMSSYCYCANNPIINLDKDGKDTITFTEQTTKTVSLYGPKGEEVAGSTDTHTTLSISLQKAPGDDTFFYQKQSQTILNRYEISNSTKSYQLSSSESSAVKTISKKEFFPNSMTSRSDITESNLWNIPFTTVSDFDQISLAKLSNESLVTYLEKHNPKEYGSLGLTQVGIKATNAAEQLAGLTFILENGLTRSGKSPWSLPPAQRGLVIEEMLGGNLPSGYKTIDKFKDGVGTSIKSIDLTSSSYQKPSFLTSKIKGYINDLVDFQGDARKGVVITPQMVSQKVLNIAIQEGKASEIQMNAIKAATEYGKQQGVQVIISKIR